MFLLKFELSTEGKITSYDETGAVVDLKLGKISDYDAGPSLGTHKLIPPAY